MGIEYSDTDITAIFDMYLMKCHFYYLIKYFFSCAKIDISRKIGLDKKI